MQVNDRKQPIGSLRISRDVIATIAGTAAQEVPGVARLATFTANNIKGMLSKRQMPRPVSIDLTDEMAQIVIQVILKDGTNIPSVSEKILESVKESVQNMTGIPVTKVNIVVAGIEFEDCPAEAPGV